MLLGLLRLGAGSGFRRGALLRLLRLGAGSGFGSGPLLRLLPENFLLLSPLLH